jgi:hypothetical protein
MSNRLNGSEQHYDFSGTLPDAAGILPLMFPDPPPDLPLVGDLRNQIDTGIDFEGSLELDGDVLMRVLNVYAIAELLNKETASRATRLRTEAAASLLTVRVGTGRYSVEM